MSSGRVQPTFRYRRLLAFPWDIDRPLDELVLVDVARAIGVYLRDLHSHHELGAWVFWQQVIIFVGRGNTLESQPGYSSSNRSMICRTLGASTSTCLMPPVTAWSMVGTKTVVKTVELLLISGVDA